MRKCSSGWDAPKGYNRLYSRNSSFFSVPNSQNSYWAGFIAADGNITEDNSVRIAVDGKDRVIIERLKEEIEYTGEIRDYKYHREKEGFYSRIEIFDKDIVIDLESNWNITPRKSKTLLPPNIHEEMNIMAFIIGYIDGDGSIGKGNRIQIQIYGTASVLEWIKENLILFCGCKFKNNIYKTKGIYTLKFIGDNSRKLMRWCGKYKGYRLERKWK
jgi:hypothetical protein